jgi:hypothetical protein
MGLLYLYQLKYDLNSSIFFGYIPVKLSRRSKGKLCLHLRKPELFSQGRNLNETGSKFLNREDGM